MSIFSTKNATLMFVCSRYSGKCRRHETYGKPQVLRTSYRSRYLVRVLKIGAFLQLLRIAPFSDKGVLDVEVPFFAPLMLPNASVSWNYSTTPQAALNDRVLIYPRGRVLGGSSSISTNKCLFFCPASLNSTLLLDFMTSTRGSDDEYDRWAELTEDRSWSWKHLSRYFFKVRCLVLTASYPNDLLCSELTASTHSGQSQYRGSGRPRSPWLWSGPD